MKKKFLLLFVAIVAITALWAADFEVGGIAYNILGDDSVEVTSKSPEYSGDITIPSIVTYSSTIYRVVSIGDYAFRESKNLTYVEIPNSVTNIGYEAFSGCIDLTSITIPKSVKSIDPRAFNFCGITSMSVEPENTIYDSRENCNAVIETATNSMVCGCLSSTIPDDIYYIGAYAFRGIDITSIVFPNNVSGIDSHSFASTKLTSIYIPSTLRSITRGAFEDCSEITSIVVEQGNDIYDSRENCNAIINTKTNTLEKGCINTIIPNSITSIGDCAFCGDTGLISITIPSNVLTVGELAFYKCNNLKKVTLQNGVKEILFRAFGDCPNIDSLIIPASVNRIADWAFLHSINSISMIEVNKNNSTFDSRDNCNAIIETATNKLLLGCQNTIIPNTISIIGKYAFTDCLGLTNIDIPYSVTCIEDGAFDGCSELISISIGESVSSIGSASFLQCINLKKIICKAIIPPIFNGVGYPFLGVNTAIPIYVPSKSVDAYKATNGWNWFFNFLPISGDFDPSHPLNPGKYQLSVTANPTVGGTITGTGEYAEGANVELTATANTGYSFIGWADGEENATRSFMIPAHDTAFVANFEIKKYLVTFNNYDGALLQSDSLTYGTMPQYTGTPPEKPSTKHWSYTFKTWNPQLVAVTQAATYTATYDSTLIALDTVIVTDEQNISDLQVGDITHVIVTETGKLMVDEPTEALSLTLYQTNTASAQVVNVSNLTVASADMVLRLEPKAEKATLAKWYAFGVPFEVEVASGISIEGANSKAQSGYDFVIDNYDGALRATSQQGWKRCQTSDVLQQGKFYMIAVNGTQNLWRFTKKAGAAITEQTSLTVNQHKATTANHSGWNGLSNSLLQSAMASMKGITYATLYRNATSTYETVLLAQSALDASHPFFVQVAKSGSVLFSEATANAPARMLAATTIDDNPIYTIAFKSESESETDTENNIGTYTDKAYLSLSETKANEYTIGLDVEKMQANTNTVPQLWLEAYGMQLAAHETVMADNAITTIPVGLYAPADGEYTLTTMHDGECRMHNAQCVMFTLLNNGSKVSPTMTNSETNTTTWTLYLTKGNNSNYALQIGERGIGTSTISFPSGENQGEASKLIINGTLYIKRDGKMYNAQGGEL